MNFTLHKINPKTINESFQEQYPYFKTEKVILNNVSISSEKEIMVSDNPYMFREVIIEKIKNRQKVGKNYLKLIKKDLKSSKIIKKRINLDFRYLLNF